VAGRSMPPRRTLYIRRILNHEHLKRAVLTEDVPDLLRYPSRARSLGPSAGFLGPGETWTEISRCPIMQCFG
jgi:hypothetical protein